MPRILCHHEGRFNLYSTITDGFVFSSSVTLSQLEEYTKEENGNQGLSELRRVLRRVISCGTSSSTHPSLVRLLGWNRAGGHESCLSVQECIDRFLS